MKLLMISASILALISAVLFLGCVGPGAEVHDCGSDIICFQAYASNCSGAKVLIDTAALAGAAATPPVPGMKIYQEIKGGTVDACSMYMKIEDISIPAGVSEEDKAQAQLMLSMLKGKDMTCTMPVSELIGATSLTSEKMMEKCSGTLADLMKLYGSTTTRVVNNSANQWNS